MNLEDLIDDKGLQQDEWSLTKPMFGEEDQLKAERECLQELECGVVLKRDMPDGYTETTWYYNLEKIIQIYERNGGKES